MGFTPARSGRIEHNGDDITSLSTYRIVDRGIGLVPQGRRIFPSLTVHEHLVIAGRVRAGGKSGWNERTVFELFPRLRDRRDNKAGTLSGGEQQMLALSRALVSNPSFLLLDEPTEGLSPALVEELQNLLVRLRDAGLSALLVEQNVGFAVTVADRVFVMEKGRVALECAPDDIRDDAELVRRYLAI
jgi:branched-chain amino acid transport system ATP-binding protein